MIPDPVQKLIDELASLPSIGPRQATRLAFYLLQSGDGKVASLTDALSGIRAMRQCDICFFYFLSSDTRRREALESDALCRICADPQRSKTHICIAEKETDIISLENARHHKGIYCILGGHMNENTAHPGNKRARHRVARLKSYITRELGGSAEEIIIAVNPTSEGDLTAMYLKKELSPLTKKISRLGRGIPTGGDIEFADEQTLEEAFKNRS